MAPKRRTSTPMATQRNQQSTLTFGKQGHNRITKSTAAQRNAKATKKDAALVDAVTTHVAEPTTAESAIEEQTAASLADVDPLENAGSKAEDVLGGRAATSDIGAVGGETGSGRQADEETQARRITDAQVKTYWRKKEAERKAPRVHQEGLSVSEKILREFDMSNQYGPCIGIARLKRWKRANTLGLNPPIEVLAVLLKEADKNNTKVQRAHVDELMSSRFIET